MLSIIHLPKEKVHHRPILLLILMALLSSGAQAQEDRLTSNAALAEKIYLQLDGTVYPTDQTLWFKAIVASAADNTPSRVSGVLHVELIAPDEHIADQKLVKINTGFGAGSFDFKESYSPGRYLLRAYTQWDKNFKEDFMFRQYIDLFPAGEKAEKDAINAINLVEREPGNFWLQAKLDPDKIDSLQKRKITVFLSLGAEKDTLTIKKNSSGKYILDYPLAKNVNVAGLTMETENGKLQSKTVSLKPDKLDVQFFPESGNLVGGLMNRIGFKVLDYAGKGVKTSGTVFSANGEKITDFESNMLGMGSFSLLAEGPETYYTKLNSANPKVVPEKYELPKVVAKGSILSVVKMGDNIRVGVFSNYLKNDSISISASCGGVAYFSIKGKLHNGKLGAVIPKDKLPEGIMAFTLNDGAQKPLAERLYFNQREDYRLKIDLATDQDTYGPREKTTLNIRCVNAFAKADSTHISVLVMDGPRWDAMKRTQKDILSYLLLGSELKGNLENPGFYFLGEDKDRYGDLDALMLTQGWRRYNYIAPPDDSLSIPPEFGLNVKGSVSALFSRKKKKENVDLTLATFGEKRGFYTQKTDSLGRFSFNIADDYGERLKMMLQSANSSGRIRDYTLKLAKEQEPKINFDIKERILKPDSTIHFLVKKNRERKKRVDSYNFASGANQLDEVVLKGYKMTPGRQKVLDTYGEADVVIDGKEILSKEKKWSYGLYSVLLFNFPKDIRINRQKKLMIPRGGTVQIDKGSYLKAEVTNGEPTLVVVDGMPVIEYSLDLIPNIPPSEVVSVEIIKYSKNFSNLYSEVHPYVSPMSIPVNGNVIAIYTKAGNGIFGVQKPKGILNFSIPVFSVQKEFYEPKYETAAQKNSTKPDLRSLIFWKPLVKTDGSGHYSTSFYNPDTPSEKVIVVEAIDSKGRLGYKTLNYDVVEDK